MFLLFTGLSGSSYGQDVWLVELQGAIGPANSDFLMRALDDAERADAELIIIRIDTPGGLDLAMRDIVRHILASPIPVASWVAPNGARAASAGTYILYASHFAAMAPATNIGSSTPVSIGGGSSPLPNPFTPQDGNSDPDQQTMSGSSAMERKVLNDATAYIKSLAELRGRNIEWAQQTVVEAANLTATEALELNVIDIIATSTDDLIQQLEGRTVEIDGIESTLRLEQSTITLIEPDWRYSFLALITDPNIAYILLVIGLYGLILEFYNPGLGLPGISGIICLLVGAYALQMLPINYAGVALILLGVAFMLVEAVSPSFGIFGFGGIASFALGSVVLMDTELEAYRISLSIVAAFTAASAVIFLYALGAVLRVRRRSSVSGVESMIGKTGIALNNFQGRGRIRAFGESWNAESEQDIEKGAKVAIIGIDGLTLKVENQE